MLQPCGDCVARSECALFASTLETEIQTAQQETRALWDDYLDAATDIQARQTTEPLNDRVRAEAEALPDILHLIQGWDGIVKDFLPVYEAATEKANALNCTQYSGYASGVCIRQLTLVQMIEPQLVAVQNFKEGFVSPVLPD